VAVRGAKIMAKLTAWERYQILKKTAEKLEARTEEFGAHHHAGGREGHCESRFEVLVIQSGDTSYFLTINLVSVMVTS